MGNFDREPLDEREEVRGVFYGNYGAVGQQFVVTNRRLLLAPIKLVKGLSDKVALEAAASIAGKMSVPGVDIVKSILLDYAPFRPQTMWLAHIRGVRAGSDGSWRRAPELVLVTDTDDEEKLQVLHKGLFTTIWDRRNKPCRDEMVAVLQAAVRDAQSAPAPDSP